MHAALVNDPGFISARNLDELYDAISAFHSTRYRLDVALPAKPAGASVVVAPCN